MKKLYMFLVPALFGTGAYTQELDSLLNIMENENGRVLRQEEVTPETDIEEPGDFYEAGDPYAGEEKNETEIIVEEEFDIQQHDGNGNEYEYEYEDEDVDDRGHEYQRDDDDRFRRSQFKGHWAGVELGLNNLFDNDFSVSRDGEAWFMDLNTNRSWVFSLNFAQYSVGIVPGYAGIVAGMGLQFNNYFFDNDITIVENAGEIEIVSLAGSNMVRSKLATIYLRVPVMFEIQFPGFGPSNNAFISAGVTGSLKLDAHTKVVYKEGDDKTNDKNWDDFNLNPFRYGITARIGSGNTNLFFDYDISTLFSEDRGPELYPFSIGFSATF